MIKIRSVQLRLNNEYMPTVSYFPPSVYSRMMIGKGSCNTKHMLRTSDAVL